MTQKSHIALKYLDSIKDSNSPEFHRSPLQPSIRLNRSPTNAQKNKFDEDEALKKLEEQLNTGYTSPSKTSLIRSKFETPSATVSSFKNFQSKQSPSNTDIRKQSPSKIKLFEPDHPFSPRKGQGRAVHATGESLSHNTQSANTSPIRSNNASSQGYEYLCRVSAIKNWIEKLIGEKVEQSSLELITYIKFGTHLAKIANSLLPDSKAVFMNDTRLQFRHTENINRFFRLLDELRFPDLFRFELTDLYDAKNIPKVFLCLHHMAYILHIKEQSYPEMEDLVGKLSFDEEEIRLASRYLTGTGLPNFNSVNSYEKTIGNSTSFSLSKLSPVKPHITSERKEEGQPDLDLNSNPFIEASPFIRKETLTMPPSKHVSSPSFENKFDAHLSNDDEVFKKVQQVDGFEYGPESSHIVKLQALIRGANFRFRMFVSRIMLKSYEDDITRLNSVIRGTKSRARTVHRHRNDILAYEDEILTLQCMARRMLIVRGIKEDIKNSEGLLNTFGCLVRGNKTRGILKSMASAIKASEFRIIQLQSLVRGRFIYGFTQKLLEAPDAFDEIIPLQAAIRRHLFNRSTRNLSYHFADIKESLTNLQSFYRGSKVREELKKKKRMLTGYTSVLRDFESIIRGGITRTYLCNNILISLIYEDEMMNEIYAIFRGKMVRKNIREMKDTLQSIQSDIITPLQSKFRGILCRFEREIMLEDIYDSVESLIKLQAIIRARRVLGDFNSIKWYYNLNLNKVIRAQSIIRSINTRSAYHCLMSMKMPPLSAIKKFAYILTDNDKDLYEELELSNLRDKIIRKTKSNEEIVQQIESIDVKLELLDKNKITVEDFMKCRNKFKPQKDIAQSSLQIIKQGGIINMTMKKGIEIYLSIYYLLQTRPTYLAKLHVHVDHTSKDPNLRQNLRHYITQLFPIEESSTNKHSREEYLLVRFISELLRVEMNEICANLPDITKSHICSWIEYFIHLNNYTYQRSHLKGMVGKLIKTLIEDDELNFECDPRIINENLRSKELNIYNFSERKSNTPAHIAIKDSEVSARFISNLTSLREYVAEIFLSLEANYEKIPLHVRLVCLEIFKDSSLNYPDKSEEQHLATAGVTFVKHYLSLIINYPENYGYQIKPPFVGLANSSMIVNNLKLLSKAVLQLFSLKPFSENFLKPLNEFLVSLKERAVIFILNLIDVKDVEQEYGMNPYDDIIRHGKPQIIINASDMVMLEKLVSKNIDVISSGPDDLLTILVSDLEETNMNAEDLVQFAELGPIRLHLNPTAQDKSLDEAKTDALFAKAKLALLYMVQVQDGKNLLELMISGISPEHEEKFRKIVEAEREENNKESSETVSPYHSASFSLHNLSYRDLKKTVLEAVLQLERMGLITRKNSYQEVLNQIASDIKTKHVKRMGRKSQLEASIKALNSLGEKERILQRQLKDYNNHVEGVLESLQLKPKNKKLFNIIPLFSKQYFYQRELKKTNRLPKFGSYKYSAKKLMDQGIILDLNGVLSQQHFSSSKFDFMFSCHTVGRFLIEIASNSVTIPGALSMLTLDDLLKSQYENKAKLELFDGMVLFNTECLVGFIFRKFYDVKRD